MDFPFIGGRIKTDLITENICRALYLKLDVKETSSSCKAWNNIEEHLAKGKAVGLKMDCYHLDGYKSINKTAKEIKKWFIQSDNIKDEFHTSAMMMERAGTGGTLFRNLYRDFLKEAFGITQIPELEKAYLEFVEHSTKWTEISNLFMEIGETGNEKYVDMASEIFIQLSNEERKTMEFLQEIGS